jgi:hypothetical protein
MKITDEDVNQMARFIVLHDDPKGKSRFYGDHGCKECVREFRIWDSTKMPGPANFRCAYHTAKAIVKNRNLVP